MGAARDFDRDYAEHTGRGDWEAHAFRLRLAVFMEPNGDRDAIDAAGRTFSNFHVNRTGTALATPVTQCPGDAATYLTPWPDVDTPGRFAGDYYFLAFDEPHDFGVLSAAPQAFGAYLDFLLAHIGPLD